MIRCFEEDQIGIIRLAKSGVACIFSALTLTRLAKVKRVLDLPCGHGRVGRHLRTAFPNAKLYFSDLDTEGVDFCADEFNGTGIYSVRDLTKAKLPRDIDVIWGSCSPTSVGGRPSLGCPS